jgi:cytochrome c peroxidase
MRSKYLFLSISTVIFIVSISFRNNSPETYVLNYQKKITAFKNLQLSLIRKIEANNLNSTKEVDQLRKEILLTRNAMKGLDFWLRYMEPLAYKKINGPLPVEWETEVFEKFEKPYKREAAGYALALLYLEEENFQKDSLLKLVKASIKATQEYEKDYIKALLKTADHFFLCNRLFLLNLSAVYTTGFDCPDTSVIIPELGLMLKEVRSIYTNFNESYPLTPLPSEYLKLYDTTLDFINTQSLNYSEFDHFTFLKNYVNPLFSMNQTLINKYNIVSKSYVDYSLNKKNNSIFSKTLYNAQNPKGIFLRVKNDSILAEIDKIGKLLFYDPILSGNNLRSCASCHKPTEYFTDTVLTTSFHFNRKDFLTRNTPSLINAQYNHLLMLDGKHISLSNQTKGVIGNPMELGSNEKEVLTKVLSCAEYNKAFKKFLKYTPQEKEITYDHVVSTITLYYSKFSNYYAPFDEAMNNNKPVEESVKQGFNLFMSKAQCATCHFVPQFNGVKPPYTNSEFEVIGTPDKSHKQLSLDQGRYTINPADETLNAFRTGSIRNAQYTLPYMHNGVFRSLEEIVNFYNTGGGAGHGLNVPNQTLSSDSLHLTKAEIDNIVSFIKALNETVSFEKPPETLPVSKNKILNVRKVGGEY